MLENPLIFGAGLAPLPISDELDGIIMLPATVKLPAVSRVQLFGTTLIVNEALELPLTTVIASPSEYPVPGVCIAIAPA